MKQPAALGFLPEQFQIIVYIETLLLPCSFGCSLGAARTALAHTGGRLDVPPVGVVEDILPRAFCADLLLSVTPDSEVLWMDEILHHYHGKPLWHLHGNHHSRVS